MRDFPGRVHPEFNRRLRSATSITNLVVPLVATVNHDVFLRTMHVPEDSLAILIEGSGRDDCGTLVPGILMP
jgi:hypothetical protein